LTPYMGLRHYLESLTILQHWANGSRLILSGHDDPIDDLHARVEDIREHRMHAESFEIPEASARTIDEARDAGARIFAVGTTCVRTLEYAAGGGGRIRPGSGRCDLFIYPGYPFKAVDAMITNFHLPRSTLLMLVSAFAGRERILAAYRAAIENGYRFFSYGDGMLII